MKKLLAVLLAVFTLLTLVGCNKENETIDPNKKSEGTMTYAEYVAAEKDSKVVIEGYVQASQSYWNGATLYVVDGEGGYFIYNDGKSEPNISQEDWEKFGFSSDFKAGWTGLATKPMKVHVEGYKSEWAEEVEIINATVTIIEPNEEYAATAVEITNPKEEYTTHQNQLVSIKDAKVTSTALYNWDGSGAAGNNNDLYVGFEIAGEEYSFCVESYLMYENSDLYNCVLALKVGDTVDLEGFLYVYYGPQLHITNLLVMTK